MTRKLSPEQFRDRLFEKKKKKHHWATPYINSNAVTKGQLNIYFHQEYVVYIRDFAVLLAQSLGRNPTWEARRALATTIYEEETGGFSLGKPHQELFLHMMNGLGFDRAGFRDVELLAPSRVYREWLDQICREEEWMVSAAVLTIFIKGNASDPEEVLYPRPAQNTQEIEDIIRKHPLVQHQCLTHEFMDYIRAQYMFAPGSRKIMYDMITHHTEEAAQQQQVLLILEDTMKVWTRYQDGIARACGIRHT